MLGPGHIETPVPSTLVSKLYANNADVPKPTHAHDFSVILFHFISYSFGVRHWVSNSFIFKYWYSLDAVQSPFSLNSLFKAMNLFGQELPGLSFVIFICFSKSLVLFLKLL